MSEGETKPEDGSMPDRNQLRGYVVAIDAFDQESASTLGDLVVIIRGNILVLVLAGIAGAILGAGVSFLVEERYQATATISFAGGSDGGVDIASIARQFGGVGALAGLQTSDSNQEEEAYATLTADQFIGNFIDRRNLLPIIFADKWDEAEQDWDAESQHDVPSRWDGIRYFKKKVLAVERDARSGLIDVSIAWREPAVAADWANGLVGLVNELARNKAIAESQASIEFLNRELESAAVLDIRQGIFRLMQSHMNTIMLANVRPDFAFRVIDPALAPDADDYDFPSRVLFLIAGGLAAGLVVLILLIVFKRR